MRLLGLVFAIALLPGQSFAQGPIGEFLDIATGLKDLGAGVSYTEKWMNQVESSFENELYKQTNKKLSGVLPIGEKWAVSPVAHLKSIVTNAQIPTKNLPVPQELWDLRAKFFYENRYGGPSGFGLFYDVGQATDKLFESTDELVYNINAYLGFGPESRTALVLFVNYANDRPILNGIPVPGFSYGLRLSPRWGITLGFPVSGLWIEPLDWLKFNFEYEPIQYFDARLSFEIDHFFDFYFSIVSDQEIYKRSGRADRAEQIVFDSVTYSAGIFQNLGPVLIDFQLGFDRNRKFTESANYLRDRSQHFLRLANGFISQLNLKIGI